MGEPINKVHLLGLMQAKRAEWEALLATAGEARMLEPGVEGAWSRKVIVAHLTACERWTLGRLQTALRGETYVATEIDRMDVDARNARFFEASRACSLAEVQAEARDVSDRRALVKSLPEADLLNPARFGFKAANRPLDIIEGNGAGHYYEHIPRVRAWLGRE